MATQQRKKRISVEFILDNAQGKFTFPNNNELNGKNIVGITIQDNTGGTMVSSSGRACVTNAAIESGFLTVQRNSVNMELSVPLKFYQEKDGDRSMRDLNINGFNPGTSYVQFVQDPATGLYRYAVGESLEMVIEYFE